MKGDGFDASTSGRKKIFAILTVVAWLLAAVPVAGVFAAPPTPTSPTGNGGAIANQIRELQADRAWLNSFRNRGINNGQNSTVNNNSLVKVWGSQYRDFVSARDWWMRGLRMKIENGGPGTSSIQ